MAGPEPRGLARAGAGRTAPSPVSGIPASPASPAAGAPRSDAVLIPEAQGAFIKPRGGHNPKGKDVHVGAPSRPASPPAHREPRVGAGWGWGWQGWFESHTVLSASSFASSLEWPPVARRLRGDAIRAAHVTGGAGRDMLGGGWPRGWGLSGRQSTGVAGRRGRAALPVCHMDEARGPGRARLLLQPSEPSPIRRGRNRQHSATIQPVSGCVRLPLLPTSGQAPGS